MITILELFGNNRELINSDDDLIPADPKLIWSSYHGDTRY